MAAKEIIYSTRPSTRYAEKTQRHYPVTEIIVDGELVGALHSGDGFMFAEIQWPDGTREAYGDCTPDHGGAADFMVRNLAARRTLPRGEVNWRGQVHAISRDWTARRAD